MSMVIHMKNISLVSQRKTVFQELIYAIIGGTLNILYDLNDAGAKFKNLNLQLNPFENKQSSADDLIET